MKHEIKWVDHKLEPRVKPNPDYPNGIDMDVSKGASVTCTVALPYPARRIGHYRIQCTQCGIVVGCTTAGRADDPRSIKIACKGH